MTTRELQSRAKAHASDAKLPLQDQRQILADGHANRPKGSDVADRHTDPIAHKLLLSPAETCKILSIQKTTLYKWLGQGLLRSRKIGGKRLIQADSVREISEACRASAGL